MIDRLVVLLLAGCAVLGVTIAVELTDAGTGAPSEFTAARPAGQAAGAPRAQAPRVDDLLATVLARPLFSPSRKPPAGETAAPPTGPDLNDLRLTGIVIEPERRLAIFAMPGAKALVRGEGETVNDWRLEAITPQQVTLSGPDGTRTLQPKIDGTLARPAPPPRPAQTARPTAPRAVLPKPARPVAPAATPMTPLGPMRVPRDQR